MLWDADESIGLPTALVVDEQVPFVGRRAERARLIERWKDAASGRGGIALLSGEPGVGKTRLAAELARAAHDDGGIVLYGRCDEELGVPYQPFVEALRPFVAACAPEDLAEHAAPYGGDLARLVPQLAERIPDLPEPLHADAETERARQFDAVTSFLANIAATAPVLLVLDDLHWAAKPTLLLVRHLARSDAVPSLLVVGTYRDTDLGRAHPLADMLADFRREVPTERISLQGLDGDEVAEFLAAAAGHELDADGERLARRVHAETEGNPFFLSQVLNHLAESGVVVQEDGHWVRGPAADAIGIPEGVREVVGRRLGSLSDDTNAVLTVAAVVGREFDHDIVVTAARAIPKPCSTRSRKPKTRVSSWGSTACPVATSSCTRSCARRCTTRSRRRAASGLHRSVGEAIASSRGDARLDELAYHFAEAARSVSPPRPSTTADARRAARWTASRTKKPRCTTNARSVRSTPTSTLTTPNARSCCSSSVGRCGRPVSERGVGRSSPIRGRSRRRSDGGTSSPKRRSPAAGNGAGTKPAGSTRSSWRCSRSRSRSCRPATRPYAPAARRGSRRRCTSAATPRSRSVRR